MHTPCPQFDYNGKIHANGTTKPTTALVHLATCIGVPREILQSVK